MRDRLEDLKEKYLHTTSVYNTQRLHRSFDKDKLDKLKGELDEIYNEIISIKRELETYDLSFRFGA